MGPTIAAISRLEAPRPLIPDSSLDEPGWWTDDKEPSVTGQGYYQLDTPTTMVWRQIP